MGERVESFRVLPLPARLSGEACACGEDVLLFELPKLNPWPWPPRLRPLVRLGVGGDEWEVLAEEEEGSRSGEEVIGPELRAHVQ